MNLTESMKDKTTFIPGYNEKGWMYGWCNGNLLVTRNENTWSAKRRKISVKNDRFSEVGA